MVLQYSFVVFPQPGASRYVFYASSQCPNWPHILPLFIWRLNKHTKNIFSFLSSSLFPQHKYGKSWNVFKPFLQILFSIFCLAAAQVWKLKHRMARGGLKVLRLTSGSGNPTIQLLQKLKMIDIKLSRNMRRKVFAKPSKSGSFHLLQIFWVMTQLTFTNILIVVFAEIPSHHGFVQFVQVLDV